MLIRLALVSSFLLMGLSAHADLYRCHEIRGHPDNRSSAVTSVRVVERADIKKKIRGGEKWDLVRTVDVSIAQSVRGKVVSVQNFKSIAKAEDVVYTVYATREHGTMIRIFLDEPNDAYMERTDRHGRISTIRLSCDR